MSERTTPHTVESGREDMRLPSPSAPQESSMAVEASQSVAPPVWQSIETAPRNGAWILTWTGPHATIPAVLYWDEYYGEWLDIESAQQRIDETDREEWSFWSPTHWMPLPALPSVSDEHAQHENPKGLSPQGAGAVPAGQTPPLSPDSLTQREIGELAADLKAHAEDRGFNMTPTTRYRLRKSASALLTLSRQVEELTRERDEWRHLEGETQTSLQAIGEEFGFRGGEPRVNGVRRVLTELRSRAEAAEQKVKDAEERLGDAQRIIDGKELAAQAYYDNYREQEKRAIRAEAALAASQAQAGALKGEALKFEEQFGGARVATLLENDTNIIEVLDCKDGTYDLVIHTYSEERGLWDDMTAYNVKPQVLARLAALSLPTPARDIKTKGESHD